MSGSGKSLPNVKGGPTYARSGPLGLLHVSSDRERQVNDGFAAEPEREPARTALENGAATRTEGDRAPGNGTETPADPGAANGASGPTVPVQAAKPSEPAPEPATTPERAPGPEAAENGEEAEQSGASRESEVSALRDDVREAIAGLAARLDREHDRAAHREAIIDRLHEENQRLRRGELQALLEPVRTALYRLHDQARRESGRWAEPDPPDPAHAASLLAAVADDVADVLSRIGVERFTAEPGEPYDAARHRPVAVAPVTEPGRAGTVVSVQADGFEQGGRVLRKAEVCVGKLPPDAEPPGEPDTPAPSSRLRDTVRSETMNTGP